MGMVYEIAEELMSSHNYITRIPFGNSLPSLLPLDFKIFLLCTVKEQFISV